ncbi:MAG: hypothetical protein ABI167_07770 [Nitrosospira sp.]
MVQFIKIVNGRREIHSLLGSVDGSAERKPLHVGFHVCPVWVSAVINGQAHFGSLHPSEGPLVAVREPRTSVLDDSGDKQLDPARHLVLGHEHVHVVACKIALIL